MQLERQSNSGSKGAIGVIAAVSIDTESTKKATKQIGIVDVVKSSGGGSSSTKIQMAYPA